MFIFGFEAEEFTRKTPVGTVFTADSTADIFTAYALLTPEWRTDLFYVKPEDEDSPGMPTITVLENSSERIRLGLGGTVEKWAGDPQTGEPQPLGLVPISGEFTIGAAQYLETPALGNYVAGVNCECRNRL